MPGVSDSDELVNHEQHLEPGRPRTTGGRAGVLVMLPFVAGYAPFALAIGAAVAAHGDPVAGWAGSWLLYGGSAHVATLHALGTGGLLAAILAGAVVNIRLVVYSTSLAQRWRDQPTWFRLAAAPFVVDPTWAVVDGRQRDDVAAERRFYFGAALTLGVGWSAMIALGVVASDRIDATHLVVAVPICLASLVGPRLRQPESWTVCAVAGSVAAIAAGVPAGGGVLVAIAAGTAAGLLGDRTRR